MSLIKSLTQFIKQNLPVEIFRGQKFTSFMDKAELARSFKLITPEQIQGGVLSYEAVLSFEQWPYRKLSPELLFMLVNVWIEELEDSENYKVVDNPAVDLEVIDEDIADITISIKMQHNLYLKEKIDGPIPFKGKRYEIESPVIWYNPDTIEVIADHAN